MHATKRGFVFMVFLGTFKWVYFFKKHWRDPLGYRIDQVYAYHIFLTSFCVWQRIEFDIFSFLTWFDHILTYLKCCVSKKQVTLAQYESEQGYSCFWRETPETYFLECFLCMHHRTNAFNLSAYDLLPGDTLKLTDRLMLSYRYNFVVLGTWSNISGNIWIRQFLQ